VPDAGALRACIRLAVRTMAGRRSLWRRRLRFARAAPQAAEEIRVCQVLFIGSTGKKHLPGILANAKGNAILTVAGSEHFVKEGGMSCFLLEENKIRFEVNLEAVQSANLRISSRLLAFAKSVIGGQEGN